MSAALLPTTVSNTATVAATETDPVGSNDSAADLTTIYNEADLSLTKTSAVAPVVPGETYSYELTVTNAGPSSAANTTISDTLPAGTSFVSALSDPSCSPV